MKYPNYSFIPEHMQDSIFNYVEKGRPMGSFLNAVFASDLFASVAKADDTNIHLLKHYVMLIYNELPFGCHGSYEKVDKWISKKGKSGI